MRSCLITLRTHPELKSRSVELDIGIACGLVIAGNVGGQGRIEYTVIGDTMNLPSRLQSLIQEVGRHTLLNEAAHTAAQATLPLTAEEMPTGEGMRYSNSGYVVLGLIIEQVAGQSYGKFLQESILTPLKMTATGYAQDQAGLAVGYMDQFSAAPLVDVSNLYAAGGLYSTVEDLYRWDQAFYTERLLPQDLLDALFTAHAVFPDTSWMAYG